MTARFMWFLCDWTSRIKASAGLESALVENKDAESILVESGMVAQRVSLYYTDVLNNFDQALPWLQIAAKCPNANAKAELVAVLPEISVGTGEVSKEIDQLVQELEKRTRTKLRQQRSMLKSREQNEPKSRRLTRCPDTID